MNRKALVDAIARCGGKQNADEIDAAWKKLAHLCDTGRYEQLLSQLDKANDRNNFLALLLEATFAFQFESHGLTLRYEVKQDARKGSSIDFLYKASSGDSIYFELRLLQQTQFIVNWIKSQLLRSRFYQVVLNAEGEQDEIVRIQNIILSKVQDKNGNTIKFLSNAPGIVNIVVVDVTDSILGMLDIHDCRLAIYGDPGVEEVYRRRVFGLFQEDRPDYPPRVHDLAAKYSNIRRTLHGVLFLFKNPGGGTVNYRLERHMMWNWALIDKARADAIDKEIAGVIPERFP